MSILRWNSVGWCTNTPGRLSLPSITEMMVIEITSHRHQPILNTISHVSLRYDPYDDFQVTMGLGDVDCNKHNLSHSYDSMICGNWPRSRVGCISTSCVLGPNKVCLFVCLPRSVIIKEVFSKYIRLRKTCPLISGIPHSTWSCAMNSLYNYTWSPRAVPFGIQCVVNSLHNCVWSARVVPCGIPSWFFGFPLFSSSVTTCCRTDVTTEMETKWKKGSKPKILLFLDKRRKDGKPVKECKDKDDGRDLYTHCNRRTQNKNKSWCNSPRVDVKQRNISILIHVISECRCNERLKVKSEGSTMIRLTYPHIVDLGSYHWTRFHSPVLYLFIMNNR